MVVYQAKKSAEDIFLTLGLAYLGQFLGHRVNELILAGSQRKGHLQIRTSHGYVIQHLVESDHPVARTGTELARRMGVSQQAVSKTVRELVRLGVAEMTRSRDGRAREVCLNQRGWEMVLDARQARAGIEARLRRCLGDRRYAEAQRALRECLKMVGGIEGIRSRRIRQPD